MIVRLVLWSLAESAVTLEELRDALDEDSGDAPGRRFAAWISDEGAERFGELSIWDSLDDSEASAPRLRELIGRDPEVWEHFDLDGWEGRL